MRFWQGWEMFIRHGVSANESLRWGMPKRLRRCNGGGYLHRNDPANPEKTRVGQPCRASSLPPLQEAQGWGSLRLNYRRVKRRASPPSGVEHTFQLASDCVIHARSFGTESPSGRRCSEERGDLRCATRIAKYPRRMGGFGQVPRGQFQILAFNLSRHSSPQIVLPYSFPGLGGGSHPDFGLRDQQP